jgi:hypothetical protein
LSMETARKGNSSSAKKEMVCSSETSANICQATQRHIP